MTLSKQEYEGKLATLKLWLKQNKITQKQYIATKFKLVEAYESVDIEKVKEVFGDGKTNL